MTLPSERKLIHRGAKFDFEQVTIAGRDGRPLTREVVRHPGAVVIIPILEPERPGGPSRLVMIRNLRIALARELLEFPAGTRERGEDPALCAGRELEEETGYAAATITPLGSFYTTPGMTDELMHAFAARGLRHVGQHLEPDENIKVEIVPTDTAFSLIDRGELADAKSMLALILAQRRGLLA
ncbi:MAG: NUDIX hydrolase [Phycisphaerales bacterium]|nr:NUDIX hydrolase [Phycisphaerales bacterium]